MDKLMITILEDGTIKTETDTISPANHMNAEAFLRDIDRLAGGVVKRVMKMGKDLRQHLHVHIADGHKH